MCSSLRVPAGRTRASVTASLAGDMLQLAVEDEGQGIPGELRQRVFDKFFRAMRDGDSAEAPASGTGMGLAIARGIVEAHRGHIWIEERNGKRGARFVLTLPIGSDEDGSGRVDLSLTSNDGPGAA